MNRRKGALRAAMLATITLLSVGVRSGEGQVALAVPDRSGGFEIERNEAVILAGVSAEFEVTWRDPAEFFSGGKWACRGSRGLLDCVQSMRLDEATLVRCRRVSAFDGAVTRFMDVYPKVEGSDIRQFREGSTGGSISGDMWDLDSHPSPAVLLGQTLKEGRYTLAELFREAREVTLRESPEEIDGAKCHVLDFDRMTPAMSADGREVPSRGWVSVWIDPDRDYRPLRIESYIDNGGKQLSMVIDRIELERIEGAWLPVKGVKAGFKLQDVIENGYTREQVLAMPEEEGRKHVRFELVHSLPPKTITVKSWKFDKEVDDGLFTIDFPEGAEVWDAFRRKRYTVGGADVTEPPDLGSLGFRRDPGWAPERLLIFIDDEPAAASVYFFSKLIEPKLKVLSATTDLEGVSVSVAQPDEGGIRHPVTVTAK
ncbi:MAG: LolA-like protein, partial [Planctomycetota bacterium]